MTADRARLSHDATRHYREVVAQQGRVTLEADVNEAARLQSEATRLGLLDVVGPVGTPDDGYKVEPAGGGLDLQVGPGTLYLGGLRLRNEAGWRHGDQPDWLDRATDPLWDAQGGAQQAGAVLLAREHEVVAAEDPALRDVALGGPDSAARTRLLQRLLLVPARTADCGGAAAGAAAFFAERGFDHDARTAALTAVARLQVTPVSAPAAASPCDPPPASGYLGADNQLIRVKVTAFDRQSGRGRLVWGWNNAATLYRCRALDATTLELRTRPVAAEFAPASGQAVELLLAGAALGPDAVAAAPDGHVATLAAPYEPDTRRVVLPAAMPAAYRAQAADLPLFLRLWEGEVAFSLGVAAELPETGLAVTIGAAMGRVATGIWWSFAARPLTPARVYPERLLDAPQPPDGPRQWMCSLAALRRPQRLWEVAQDCRPAFLPLTQVEPGGCCGRVVTPAEVAGGAGLQAALDALRGTGGTLSLRPGRYRLPAPLRLDASHAGLTVEGCSDGAVLEAEREGDPAFFAGLVLLHEGAARLTLRGLRLRLPLARLDDRLRAAMEDLLIEASPVAADGGKLHLLSVGVTAVEADDTTIEGCVFDFPRRVDANLLAVGVLSRGTAYGQRLLGNRFQAPPVANAEAGLRWLLFGHLLSPEADLTVEVGLDRATLRRPRTAAALDRAEISDNRFVGMGLAVCVVARLGRLRCAGNVVEFCAGGMLFANSRFGATLAAARLVFDDAKSAPPAAVPHAAFLSRIAEFLVWLPWPNAIDPAGKPPSAKALALVVRDKRNRAAQLLQPVPPKVAPIGGTWLLGLEYLAAAAEGDGGPTEVELELRDNLVRAEGAMPRPEDDPRPATAAVAAPLVAPFAGLTVLLELGVPDDVAMLSGNRVAMGGTTAPACLLLWPSMATVTGNLLSHPAADKLPGMPALVVAADAANGARLEAMANVVRGGAAIFPPQRPAAPSRDWGFVNRLG